jgi:hypothetical protein
MSIESNTRWPPDRRGAACDRPRAAEKLPNRGAQASGGGSARPRGLVRTLGPCLAHRHGARWARRSRHMGMSVQTIHGPRLRSVTAVTGRPLSMASIGATQRPSTPSTGARKAIRVPSRLMRTTLRSRSPKIRRRGSSSRLSPAVGNGRFFTGACCDSTLGGRPATGRKPASSPGTNPWILTTSTTLMGGRGKSRLRESARRSSRPASGSASGVGAARLRGLQSV